MRFATIALLPLTACAHLGPFPMPEVRYGEAVGLPLVQVPEDTRRLYVVVQTESMGEQLWFFDTGYSHTTCDAATVEALGLPTRRSLARTRGELGSVRLEKARIPSFNLGGHEVRGLRCAVRDIPGTSSIPAGESYNVAGVIGSNLLRRFVVEVDPSTGLLTLHDPSTYDFEPTFRARREWLVGPRLRVPVELDGARVWPVLDYGATGTYLDAERLGLPLVEERQGQWQGTGNNNIETRTLRYYWAESTSLGEVEGPPIYVVDRQGFGGLVGMNLLMHYRVVLDYQSRQMQVEQVQPAELPLYSRP